MTNSMKWKTTADEFFPSSQSESLQTTKIEKSDGRSIEGMMDTMSLSKFKTEESWEKDDNRETIKETEDIDESTTRNISKEESTSAIDDIPVEESKEHLNIVFIGHVGKSNPCLYS
jgi:hypothetical protein